MPSVDEASGSGEIDPNFTVESGDTVQKMYFLNSCECSYCI